MAISDFECQIARGQIGRYLDGGVLSAQAMTGLEEHLAECPSCKAAVADRRAALLGDLGGKIPTHAVAAMPIENPLIAALRAKAEPEEAKPAAPKVKAAPRYVKEPSKKSLGKPLALAALLAVVLVAMSRISHTINAPTARADASFAAQTLPAEKVETPKEVTFVENPLPKESVADSREMPTPKAQAPKPLPKPTPRPTPAKLVVVKPKVVNRTAPKRVVHPKPRAKMRPTVRRKPAHKVARNVPRSPRRPRTTVRVYGLDGNLLKP